MPRDGAPLPILVFDLDGTILDCNSFPAWALHLISGRVPGLPAAHRIALSRTSLGFVLKRRLGRIDHDRLMHGLQSAWAASGATDDTLTRFVETMLRRVRPCLRPALDLVVSGADALMATAAAADYAVELGARLGFRHVLSTSPACGATEGMNHGARKRDRVIRFLQDRGWADRPIIFFNDHLDDLPLMERSSVVCWFGKPALLRSLRQALPDVQIFDCRGYDASRMAELLTRFGLAGTADCLESAAS